MKALHLSEDVVPVGEFKSQASRVLRQLKATHRPVVITHNGRPAAVLITPEEYDRLNEFDLFREAVSEGIQDSDAGRTVGDEVLNAELETLLSQTTLP